MRGQGDDRKGYKKGTGRGQLRGQGRDRGRTGQVHVEDTGGHVEDTGGQREDREVTGKEQEGGKERENVMIGKGLGEDRTKTGY